MPKLSRKWMIIYFLIGTLSSILHYAWKVDSIPLTRLVDCLFAGCLIPIIIGIVFWTKKKETLSYKEPFLVGGIFLGASLILTVFAMM